MIQKMKKLFSGFINNNPRDEHKYDWDKKQAEIIDKVFNDNIFKDKDQLPLGVNSSLDSPTQSTRFIFNDSSLLEDVVKDLSPAEHHFNVGSLFVAAAASRGVNPLLDKLDKLMGSGKLKLLTEEEMRFDRSEASLVNFFFMQEGGTTECIIEERLGSRMLKLNHKDLVVLYNKLVALKIEEKRKESASEAKPNEEKEGNESESAAGDRPNTIPPKSVVFL